MKYLVFLALLLIVACAPAAQSEFDEVEHPEDHGTSPTEMPQFEEELLQPVVTESLVYFEDISGYYARPQADAEYPGIIMIHEWWGLNEHIEQEARQLASQGYHVLAVDLFGSVADNPNDARAQTQALEQDVALENMKAGVLFLQDQQASSIASLGWCFGGGQSLLLGLQDDVAVDATVIYYGRVETDESVLASIDQPVLGIFGSEDGGIPVQGVREFEAGLTVLNVENSINVYEGVGHAFANPDNDGFAEDEARDAYQKTLDFLASTLN